MHGVLPETEAQLRDAGNPFTACYRLMADEARMDVVEVFAIVRDADPDAAQAVNAATSGVMRVFEGALRKHWNDEMEGRIQ